MGEHVGVIVGCQVQFGINCINDVWKFGKNFPNIKSAINPKLYEQPRMVICLLLP